MGSFTRRLATPHTAPLTSAEVRACNAALDWRETDAMLATVREAVRRERMGVEPPSPRAMMEELPPNPLRIYLDDERPTPEGWVGCRWPHEVIEHLQTGNVVELDLDWYLGEDPDRGGRSGADVVEWLETAVKEGDLKILPLVRIHTSDPNMRYELSDRVRKLRQFMWQRANNQPSAKST